MVIPNVINEKSVADLHEALSVADIQTGTTLNVMVYKAFVGEPFYPTVSANVKSRAPFFNCEHVGKHLVAPEPPYYSTNFNTLVRLIKTILPMADLSLNYTDNEFCIVLVDGTHAMIRKHEDMHVAALRTLVAAIQAGWPLPRQ